MNTQTIYAAGGCPNKALSNGIMLIFEKLRIKSVARGHRGDPATFILTRVVSPNNGLGYSIGASHEPVFRTPCYPQGISTLGFRPATDTEQFCRECREHASNFLRDQDWLDVNWHNLCTQCMRSPVEYLLGQMPEHAVWFERMTRLAAHGTYTPLETSR